jgi:four helix bundle protein
MKRAAVSIRLNIVEGAACESPAEYARYLEIAYRSVRKTLTSIELAVELELCKADRVDELLTLGERLAGTVCAYRKLLREPMADSR